MKNYKVRFACFLILASMVSGCIPLVKSEQPALTDFVLLNHQQTIGQTFVAGFDGLQSISVYLKPNTISDGTLKLSLREHSEDLQEIRTATIPLKDVIAQANYQFSFAPINKSNQREYYLNLELEGSENGVMVGIAPGGSYMNGSFYEQATPGESQLTFLLQFNPIQAFSGLLVELLIWFGWVAAFVFLCVPLGWAILHILWRSWDNYSWIEKICLAAGTGLAIYPVVILITHSLGIDLGAQFAWLLPLISIGYLTWHSIKAGTLKEIRKSVKLKSRTNYVQYLPSLTFLCIVFLVFATRFWNIRALEVPMWGDSYQHTMISQLILDNNGLFSSWMPYVPYQSLSVHFGYSLFVALFSWITNIPAVPATLIFGQIINGFAVMLLYPWTMRISHSNQWAACAAVLIAGLITQTPAIYVNWGRYAQLMGQAIFPVVFVLFWDVLNSQITRTEQISGTPRNLKSLLRFSWLQLGVVGTVLAGMTLSYYRMPYYFITLVAAWLIAWALPRLRLDIPRWINLFLAMLICSGFAMLLVIPWLNNLVKGNATLLSLVKPPAVPLLSSVLADYRTWLEITSFLPGIIIGICGISIVVSMLRKEWIVASLGLWVFLLSLIVAGRLIHFPGTAAMQNFAIIIMLYIPASLLVGWLVGEITGFVPGKWHNAGDTIISICLLVFALFGSIKIRNVADPNYYAMVNRPDLRAMEWIKENTPVNARFLVEGFRIYGGTSAVGADAGWWIPLLTGRQNTMPPQYALLNEVPSPSDYSTRVVNLVSNLENNSPGSLQSVQQLCKENITHAYIGQSQGLVGFGVQQLFSPDDFLNSPFWRPVYHEDRVHIYELDPNICLQENLSYIQQ